MTEKMEKDWNYSFQLLLALSGTVKLAWEIRKNKIISHRVKFKLIIFPLQRQNIPGNAKNVPKLQHSIILVYFEGLQTSLKNKKRKNSIYVLPYRYCAQRKVSSTNISSLVLRIYYKM